MLTTIEFQHKLCPTSVRKALALKEQIKKGIILFCSKLPLYNNRTIRPTIMVPLVTKRFCWIVIINIIVVNIFWHYSVNAPFLPNQSHCHHLFISVCRNRRLTIRLLPIFTKLLSRNILSVTNNIQSDVLRELNIVDWIVCKADRWHAS